MTKNLVPSVKAYIQKEKAALAERNRIAAAQEAEERRRAAEAQERRVAEQVALQEKQPAHELGSYDFFCSVF